MCLAQNAALLSLRQALPAVLRQYPELLTLRLAIPIIATTNTDVDNGEVTRDEVTSLYRQRELLNTRRVPIVLKVGLTSVVTGTMCYLLYQDHLYDEETYRTALKFRDKYDTVEVPIKTGDVFS